MKQFINRNLISLKCVLFCFLAGVGCIFPFLPLHMLAIGLTADEAKLVSIVAPCVAMIGPLVAGPLADRLSVGRGAGGGNSTGSSGRILRLLTASCLLLSALFYALLLAVPTAERHPARRSLVAFTCDMHGATVLQEMCDEQTTCGHWQGEKKGFLELSECKYACDADPSEYIVRPEIGAITTTEISPYEAPAQTIPSTHDYLADEEGSDLEDDQLGRSRREDEENRDERKPPHLCQGESPEVCHVYTPQTDSLKIEVALLSAAENATEPGWCAYPNAGLFQCKTHLADPAPGFQPNQTCRTVIRCSIKNPYDVKDAVLAGVECRKTKGDPVATFWTYLILRCIADIWPTAALGLLGAACVVATRDTSLGRGDVGRQLAAGTLALALLPPLAGKAAFALDAPFALPILLAAIFMCIGAAILMLDGSMPLSPPEWWWHTASGLLAMPMNTVRRYGAEIAGLFAVLTLLGILWGALDSYIPWTLMALHGDPGSIGLTLTVGALPALPVLYWAEPIVDYCGHSNLFITAFTFYAVRYTGMSLIEDHWQSLVFEALEVFTLSLVWVTAVLYFRHLVPRKYTCTGQALPVLAHFCLGRCVGSVVGGLVVAPDWLDASRALSRALAVFALLAAAVYLALYHLLLAPRCQAPKTPPPQTLLQGTNNGNGTYSPIRVYHEERARKGQFRY